MDSSRSRRVDPEAGPWRVAVVGAGIAGLAASLAILERRPGAHVVLLDAAERTGGKLRLGEVAGHPVDLGAEALLARRPEALDLARDVGLGEQIVHPRTTSAGVWTRGAIRPLPRSVMGVPADLDALAYSGVVSPAGVERARAESDLPPITELGDDVGIGALVAERLGPEVRDRLVDPLLGGVYAGRADDLSLRACVPQLVGPLAEHHGLLPAAAAAAPARRTGTPQTPVFAGLSGGVASLAAAVGRAVRDRGADIRTSTTVRELRRTATGFSLITGPTTEPQTLAVDAVVLATPAIPSARLLGEVAPAAAADLSAIDYASMALVTLALEGVDDGALDGSGFLVPAVDGHRIKAATYSSRKWGWHPAGLTLIRCSIGRFGDAPELQRDDRELVDDALRDIRAATGIAGQLVDAAVTRWGGALPQYTVGHLDRVRRVRAAVAAVPGLAVCGAAYDGVGVPACIASAQAAVTRLVEERDRRGTMAR